MTLESFCFIPLYKPVGPTSHDMVDTVRRLVTRKLKVGHTGTLDPFASGVLIIAVGKATRFAEDVHLLPKQYKASLRLGVSTDTLDPTGQVDGEMKVPEITRADLERLEQSFTGTSAQIPPHYSAKKIAGRKSYELARENKPVELEPKEITIHKLRLDILDNRTLGIDVSCSTGTYIRALGRDIAEALGTKGHLISLERTAVGPLTTAQCVAPDALDEDNLGRYGIPVAKLLSRYPEIMLPPDAFAYLQQGRPFPVEERAPSTFLGVFRDQFGEIQAIFRCAYEDEAIHSRMLCFLRET